MDGLQNGYVSNLSMPAFFCLDIDCKLRRRMYSEDLSNHSEHLTKCVTTRFLMTVAENTKQKLLQCTQIEDFRSFQLKISGQLDKVNQLINSLKNQSFENYDIVSQLLTYYHGLTEDEIVNMLYNELTGIDPQLLIATKDKISIIFNNESTQYIKEKLIDLALVLKKVQNFDGALENLKLALKLIQDSDYEAKTSIIQKRQQFDENRNGFLENATRINQQKNIVQTKPQIVQQNFLNQLMISMFTSIQKKPYSILFSEIIALIMQFVHIKEIQQGLIIILFNRKEQALIYFSEQLKLQGIEQRIDLCYANVLILLAFKREQEVFKLLENCIEIYEQDWNFKLLKLLSLMIFEYFNEARAMLISDLKPILESISCQKFSIFYYLYVKDYLKALQISDYLLNEYPNNDVLLYIKTLILTELNQQHRCYQYIDQIQVSGNQRKSILTLRLQQKYEKALKLIEIQQQNDLVSKEDLKVEQIICLYEMQNYEMVNKQLEEIFLQSKNPINWIRVQLIKFLNNFQLQSFEQAFQDLDELAQFLNQKNKLQITYLKGQLLFNQQKYDDSLKCFNLYCEKFNYSIQAYFFMGIIKCYQREFQDAIHLFDQALNIRENYYPAIYNQGIAYILSSRYEEAEMCFLKSQSHYARSQLMLVFCKFFKGNKNIEIIMSIMKEIRKYHRYAFVLKIAAYIIADNYEEARQYIDQYYANHQMIKHNQDNLVLLCKGMILYKTNEREGLKQWFSEVQRIKECQRLSEFLSVYCNGDDPALKNQSAILACYLESLMIIKYDLKELQVVPLSIDILHYQIDIESFANYIRILFD